MVFFNAYFINITAFFCILFVIFIIIISVVVVVLDSLSSFVDAFLGILTGILVVVVNAPLYIIIIIPIAWNYLRVQNLYRNVAKVFIVFILVVFLLLLFFYCIFFLFVTKLFNDIYIINDI